MITNKIFVLTAALCIFAIAFPVVLLILWRKQTKAPLLPALFGALTFLLFAMVLEQIPAYFLVVHENPVSSFVLSHTWCYAIVGALLAGIFEETGRFCAFSLLKKSHTAKQTAITYGIGHGGFECLLLVGISSVEMFVFAVMIRTGTWDTLLSQLPAESLDQMQQVRESLETMTAAAALLSMWERVCAVTFHIAMSVLVFFSVHRKNRRYLYPLAILLHMGLDIFAALYQSGVFSIYTAELLITVFTVLTVVPVFLRYRKAPEQPAN